MLACEQRQLDTIACMHAPALKVALSMQIRVPPQQSGMKLATGFRTRDGIPSASASAGVVAIRAVS